MPSIIRREARRRGHRLPASLPRVAVFCLTLVLTLAASGLTASAESFPGTTPTGGTGIVDVQSAGVMPPGGVSLGLGYEHFNYLLTKIDPRDDFYRLGLTAGIAPRTELYATLPYRELEITDKQRGIADGLVGLKFRFNAPEASVGLAGTLALSLPFGDEDKGLGTGRYDTIVGLVASRDIGPAQVSGQVGYRFITAGDDLLQFGAGIMFPMSSPLRFFAEYYGTSGQQAHYADNDGGVDAGVRVDLGRHFQFTGGAGTGLHGFGAVGNDWRFFAGVTWYPGGIPGTAPATPPAAPPPPPPPPVTVAPKPVLVPPPPEAPKPVPAPAPYKPAPAPAPVPAPAPAPAAPATGTLPVEDVFFDFDHMVMTPDEEAKLKAVAEYLKAYPGVRIIVEGHCDSRGTAAYNIGLGDRRSRSVAYYLIYDLGVSPARVEYRSLGEMQPAESNATDAGRARNRRGHLTIVK